MRHGKRDANHGAVLQELRSLGWFVEDTANVGPNAIPGFPDAIAVGFGVTLFCEIKDGWEPLTDAERAFQERFRGEYVVIRSLDEVKSLTRSYASRVLN